MGFAEFEISIENSVKKESAEEAEVGAVSVRKKA